MFVAVFIPALLGALATVMASLIGRAILALGIGFVTYKGVTVMIDALKAQVIASIGGIGGDALSLIGLFGLDRGISVIFSAYAVVLAMKFANGTVKRMGFKNA